MHASSKQRQLDSGKHSDHGTTTSRGLTTSLAALLERISNSIQERIAKRFYIGHRLVWACEPSTRVVDRFALRTQHTLNQETNMFREAYIRLAAFVIQNEGCHTVEFKPRATMIERIQATCSLEETGEILHLTIEETK